MKPTSGLSALASPVVTNVTGQSGGAKSSSKVVSTETFNSPSMYSQAEVKNPSPESNSSYTTRTTQSSTSDKMDKKLISSGDIATNLKIKSFPLSIFTTSNKVGSSFGAAQHQQAILNYQQQQQQSNTSLPLPANDRKVRDSGALLFMMAFLGFLGYVIWDGIVVKETDINLIVHGHDSYGNICGRQNKPLKLVEKSGKNFTDKPYTKYTLINAQFERYSLDPDRSKNGDLFYIKQDVAPLNHVRERLKASDGNELETKAQNKNTSATLSNQQQAASSNYRGQIRFVRETTSRSRRESEYETLNERRKQLYEVKNQTALNNLKASLMYQYPPMYGYKESEYSHATTIQDASVSSTRHRVLNQAATQAISRASSGAGSTTSQANVNQGKPSTALELEQGQQIGASGTMSSFSHTLNGAIPSTSRRQASQLEAASFNQTVTTLATLSSTMMPFGVSFDDKLDSENETLEHMLVDTTSLQPRNSYSPSVLHHNDVSNSLLYLTECVDQCPIDHVELIFYRCMPKNWRFSLFPNAINVTQTFIDDIITDISHCYRELIYILSFALVLSLALLILLRYLGTLIIWSCLITLITLLLSMTTYSWLTYYNQVIDLNNNLMPHNSIYEERLVSSDKWLFGAIFLTFVSLATIGTVIFMRKRIILVTTLFKESGKAIADMPLLLLQPLLTFAALVSITVIWSVGLICLQSMKIPVLDMTTGFVVFKAETLYKIMKWYHVFAFLWVSHFAIACQHYVIGAAVSKWYFSTNRYSLHSPIGSSVSELILYYLGTVALGSFLVAIFKVVRIIVRQIQYLVQRNCMSNHNPNNGGISQYATALNSTQMSTSCCGSLSYVWRLFIWFFDNIVMIINRDAYVEVAIYGHSFIGGAQKAFSVLASNPLRLLAIKSVSNVLLVVAKICVVFGTISMATVLLEEKSNQLNYSWSPVVICAIYAYVVAHWFLSVYEMVIDALFICYCEDYERSKNLEVSAQITGSRFMSQVLNSENHLF